MSKILAALIASAFAVGAFAQTPASAPAPMPAASAAKPMSKHHSGKKHHHKAKMDKGDAASKPAN